MVVKEYKNQTLEDLLNSGYEFLFTHQYRGDEDIYGKRTGYQDDIAYAVVNPLSKEVIYNCIEFGQKIDLYARIYESLN